jgi:hypothetical protein
MGTSQFQCHCVTYINRLSLHDNYLFHTSILSFSHKLRLAVGCPIQLGLDSRQGEIMIAHLEVKPLGRRKLRAIEQIFE